MLPSHHVRKKREKCSININEIFIVLTLVWEGGVKLKVKVPLTYISGLLTSKTFFSRTCKVKLNYKIGEPWTRHDSSCPQHCIFYFSLSCLILVNFWNYLDSDVVCISMSKMTAPGRRHNRNFTIYTELARGRRTSWRRSLNWSNCEFINASS